MRQEYLNSTIPAMLLEMISRHEEHAGMRFFSDGAWRTWNWREVGERLKNLAMGWIDLGLQAGDRVAIIGPNTPYWTLTDFSLASVGVVTVPIYTTLDAATICYILEDSNCQGVVMIGEAAAERMQQAVAMMRQRPKKWFEVGADFDDLLQRGATLVDRKPFFERLEKLQRQDLYTIIYTSGTTGQPKGVMLSHANLLADIAAGHERNVLRFGAEVYLSLLPLSHIYERYVHYLFISVAAEIAYARSFDLLGEDLQAVQPTIFSAVPRIFEKFHARVLAQVEKKGALGRAIFRWAVRKGMASLEGERGLGFKLAKLLVLNKIRRRMGQRLRFVISGGNALRPELAKFFHGAGIIVAEGYGLTETGIVAWNPLHKIKFGSVGQIFVNVEAKIGDEGELLFRSPITMMGYLGKPKETSQAIDSEGWLHTGDVAQIDGDRYLTITGRLKDLLKTSGGKMVAPFKVEELFRAEPWCEQICLLGEGRPYLVALLVLDPLKTPVANRPLAELVLDETIWPWLEQQVEKVNQQLAPYETVKRFALLPEAFTEAGGTLTPTLKLKRFVVAKQYSEVIDALYGRSAKIINGTIPLLPREFKSNAND